MEEEKERREELLDESFGTQRVAIEENGWYRSVHLAEQASSFVRNFNVPTKRERNKGSASIRQNDVRISTPSGV